KAARIPKAEYHGDYLIDIARRLIAEVGARYRSQPPDTFRDLATIQMIAQPQIDLEAFGVRFDTWFYESSLYESDAVKQAIEEIKARGMAYEKDGALWLKTTELAGDDQDRVLVRSNDRETYVAADATYHKNKFDRGFTR